MGNKMGSEKSEMKEVRLLKAAGMKIQTLEIGLWTTCKEIQGCNLNKNVQLVQYF